MAKRPESVEDLASVLALVSENLKGRLYQVATLSDVLRGLHLVACQHPHLDLGSNQVPDRLRNLVLESIEHSSGPDEVDALLEVRYELVEGLFLIGGRQVLAGFLEGMILLLRDDPHPDQQRPEADSSKGVQLVIEIEFLI